MISSCKAFDRHQLQISLVIPEFAASSSTRSFCFFSIACLRSWIDGGVVILMYKSIFSTPLNQILFHKFFLLSSTVPLTTLPLSKYFSVHQLFRFLHHPSSPHSTHHPHQFGPAP